jgi:Protein of unknown function (DUF3617)
MGMRHWFGAGILSLGLVAACSQAGSPPGAPQSAEEARQEVAQAVDRMEVGQWRTTITIVEANVPGVPAEIARQMIGQPITVEECRTSDDPQTATDAWMQAEEGCEAGTFRLTGNRFEGTQRCTSDGVTMDMAFTGTLTPTRMEGETQISGQTPAGAMTQRATVVSERLGPCAG